MRAYFTLLLGCNQWKFLKYITPRRDYRLPCRLCQQPWTHPSFHLLYVCTHTPFRPLRATHVPLNESNRNYTEYKLTSPDDLIPGYTHDELFELSERLMESTPELFAMHQNATLNHPTHEYDEIASDDMLRTLDEEFDAPEPPSIPEPL